MIAGKWWLICILIFPVSSYAAATCHYQDWRWNIKENRAVQHKIVAKELSLLRHDERDLPSGCSVCAEDQQQIKLDGIPEFSLCYKYAPRVHAALAWLLQQGANINSVVGYRVGRTRGKVDSLGNRVGFSNHSYGIAIDINASHNGLYDNCVEFGPQCRLIRGGLWQPAIDPYSLQQDGLIVKMLKEIGFKWGGEIKGRQKDFMHFSLTGY